LFGKIMACLVLVNIGESMIRGKTYIEIKGENCHKLGCIGCPIKYQMLFMFKWTNKGKSRKTLSAKSLVNK